MRVDRHLAGVEHREPRGAQLRAHLEGLALARSHDRTEATRLFFSAQPPQVLVGDPERFRESAQVDLPGLRERHRQDVPRPTIVAVFVERADQRAADEHVRDRSVHDDHAVRRKPPGLVRRRR